MDAAHKPSRKSLSKQHWMERIPGIYRSEVLGLDGAAPPLGEDPNCMAQLTHYRSLFPMARDTRKPVFDLKPADGAFGGQQAAVRGARHDFTTLAEAVAAAVDLPMVDRFAGTG